MLDNFEKKTKIDNFLGECAENNFEVFTLDYDKGYVGFRIKDNDRRLFHIAEGLKKRYPFGTRVVFRSSQDSSLNGVILKLNDITDSYEVEEFFDTIEELVKGKRKDVIGRYELMEAICSRLQGCARDIFYFNDDITDRCFLQFQGASVCPRKLEKSSNCHLEVQRYNLNSNDANYVVSFDNSKKLMNFVYEVYEDKRMEEAKKGKKLFEKKKS